MTCHTERDLTKYGGPVKPDHSARAASEFFGDPRDSCVYSKNITPAAIGSWTDGELIRAFTAGVNEDGTPLFPMMPYPRYGAMSREDVEAIVAYLRTLKPIRTPSGARLALSAAVIVRTMPRGGELRGRCRRDRQAWPTANT